jgi:hypothetical protein
VTGTGRPVNIPPSVRPKARAYHNHGRWIADCPRPGCTNAQALDPGQWQFDCGALPSGLRTPDGCNLISDVEWPGNAAEITAELARRPVPSTRNWFPAEHELAVRAGCPHGQSVKHLADEFREFDPEFAKASSRKGGA